MEASPLFRSLGRELLDDKLLHLRHHRHPKGSLILRPEDTAKRVNIVIRGRVKLVAYNVLSDRELTLFLLTRGDMFNVASLLDGKPQDLTAYAVDEVETLSGECTLIRDWIERHPEFNREFLPYLGERLLRISDLASDLALHDTGVRLANLILRHVEGNPAGPTTVPRLINDLSQDEIGDMIGTVRVVANRQLRHLQRDGIVQTSRGRLVVRDLQRLRDLCGQRGLS